MNYLIITDRGEMYTATRLQPHDFRLIHSGTIKVFDLRLYQEVLSDFETKTVQTWEK
jgi:hypothetical protein